MMEVYVPAILVFVKSILVLIALKIFAFLKQLSAIPGTAIAGETGTLSLNQTGQVERTLLWARFKEGTPLSWHKHRIAHWQGPLNRYP